MNVQFPDYYKVEGNNFGKSPQFPICKVSKDNRIRIIQVQTEVKNNEYYAYQQNQQQQQKQRSISQQPEEKIRYFNPISINQNTTVASQPNQQFQIGNNQIQSSHWNNKIGNSNIKYTNQIYSQNPKVLQDQIDIAVNQQRQNSINKKQQFNYDIFKKQKLDSRFIESGLPPIHKQNNQYQQLNSRPISQQKSIKNDSLNCTQSSFMKTQESTCYSCKQDISGKRINLICWHHYHPECLSEILKNQISQNNTRTLPKCLCGLNIKQQIISQLKEGTIFIQNLMEKQLDLIYKKYSFQLKKCPTCKFRFIQDNRLTKMCYCEICNKEFKIQ